MMIAHFFLLVFMSCVNSKNLSPAENKILQKTCGRFKNFKSELYQKSHGGVQLHLHSIPWVAYVGMKRQDGMWGACSGTQISSRHILTAAHCVLEHLPSQSNHPSERPIQLSENLLIRVGSSCTETFGDCKNKNSSHYRAKKIVMVAEFDKNYHAYADLAVIEVDRKIPKSEGSPVCIPGDPIKNLLGVTDFNQTALKNVLYGAGYGGDKTKNETALLQLFEVEPVFEAESLYVKGVNSSIKAQAAEGGDSGSGLVQIEDDGQIVVVGIESRSDGHYDESSVDLDQLDILTDVRKYVSFICVHTGVCAGRELSDIDVSEIPSAIVYEKPSNC